MTTDPETDLWAGIKRKWMSRSLLRSVKCNELCVKYSVRQSKELLRPVYGNLEF
jgi:hypothetical protein